jgi:hypothetical protein
MYILNNNENEKTGVVILTNGPFTTIGINYSRLTANAYKELFELIIQKANDL